MKSKLFNFQIISNDKNSKARAGIIHTQHGDIQTPAFVAVGTRATVRGLTPEDLKEIGVQLLFGNTYHLHLRPGEERVEEFGGLGKFMGWDGPTITDSGGFQVFSLGQKKMSVVEDEEETQVQLVKIKDDGVTFRSHIDGSLHEFTPEISIEIQKKLGADLILCFDDCPPHPSTHEQTKAATQRTHRWAVRSLEAFRKTTPYPNPLPQGARELHFSSPLMGEDEGEGEKKQALYGIIQGGVYQDLREESAKYISSLEFDGIAIGGVSVGESKKQMRDVLQWVHPFLPEEKPRHLLGIGEIDDIFAGVEMGMDTFDCVIPTRFGRYGILFVSPEESEGKPYSIDITKVQYAKDNGPLSKDCECHVCTKFTRAYVHHLFRAKELLAYRLASYHNMYFIIHLVKQIRQSIVGGTFDTLRKNWLQ